MWRGRKTCRKSFGIAREADLNEAGTEHQLRTIDVQDCVSFGERSTMTHLYKCSKCGQYTLEQKKCPKCGETVSSPKPSKYSPQDKYGDYRRKAKRKTKAVSSE